MATVLSFLLPYRKILLKKYILDTKALSGANKG